MVWDKLLPPMIQLTTRNKIMFNFEFDMSVLDDSYTVKYLDGVSSLLAQAIVFDQAIVVVSIINGEVQFVTYEGTDMAIVYDTETLEGFIYTGNPFTMTQLMVIKDTLLGMLSNTFREDPSSILQYAPTCIKRGRIYMTYLKRSGYTVTRLEDGDYTITL